MFENNYLDYKNINDYFLGGNLPRVPVDVNVRFVTSSSATLSWFFQRNETQKEIISIFYGTSSEELGRVITYSIPSDPNMEQYSIQLLSLQPGTRYVYQIYSSNGLINQTDGMEYEFRTNDSSEFSY